MYHRCDTKGQRERNENVGVDQGCDTKGHRERNENVEVDHRCDTKGQRGMRMLRWIKGVTLRDREREE